MPPKEGEMGYIPEDSKDDTSYYCCMEVAGAESMTSVEPEEAPGFIQS